MWETEVGSKPSALAILYPKRPRVFEVNQAFAKISVSSRPDSHFYEGHSEYSQCGEACVGFYGYCTANDSVLTTTPKVRALNKDLLFSRLCYETSVVTDDGEKVKGILVAPRGAEWLLTHTHGIAFLAGVLSFDDSYHADYRFLIDVQIMHEHTSVIPFPPVIIGTGIFNSGRDADIQSFSDLFIGNASMHSEDDKLMKLSCCLKRPVQKPNASAKPIFSHLFGTINSIPRSKPPGLNVSSMCPVSVSRKLLSAVSKITSESSASTSNYQLLSESNQGSIPGTKQECSANTVAAMTHSKPHNNGPVLASFSAPYIDPSQINDAHQSIRYPSIFTGTTPMHSSGKETSSKQGYHDRKPYPTGRDDVRKANLGSKDQIVPSHTHFLNTTGQNMNTPNITHIQNKISNPDTSNYSLPETNAFYSSNSEPLAATSFSSDLNFTALPNGNPTNVFTGAYSNPSLSSNTNSFVQANTDVVQASDPRSSRFVDANTLVRMKTNNSPALNTSICTSSNRYASTTSISNQMENPYDYLSRSPGIYALPALNDLQRSKLADSTLSSANLSSFPHANFSQWSNPSSSSAASNSVSFIPEMHHAASANLTHSHPSQVTSNSSRTMNTNALSVASGDYDYSTSATNDAIFISSMSNNGAMNQNSWSLGLDPYSSILINKDGAEDDDPSWRQLRDFL